jgi:hypothetical protein
MKGIWRDSNSQPLEPQPSAPPLSYKHRFRFYQKKKVAKVKINVAKTKPKNLTHPSLVKIS